MRKRYSTALPIYAISAGLLVIALLAGSLGADRNRAAAQIPVQPAPSAQTLIKGDAALAELAAEEATPPKTHARHLLRMPYFSFAQSQRSRS